MFRRRTDEGRLTGIGGIQRPSYRGWRLPTRTERNSAGTLSGPDMRFLDRRKQPSSCNRIGISLL